MPHRLVVLGTGGTIAGSAGDRSDHVGYVSAQLGIAELLQGIKGFAHEDLVVEQVAQLDSKDMDHATWQRLAHRVIHHLTREEVAAVLITHGTDTLEETAWFLDRVVATDRPVVLTAAMRPATALQADGPQNLVDAASVARWPGAGGVVAVLAGQVIAARDLRKLHPYRLDAFGAGDVGKVGAVEQGRVRHFRNWPLTSIARGARRGAALHLDPTDWPWVEIVTSHAGADARQIDALVSAGVDGIVVAGTGNGTVHRSLDIPLRRAAEAGIATVRCTRCATGSLVGADFDQLLDADASSVLPPLAGAGSLTAVQARIELMLWLMERSAGSTGDAGREASLLQEERIQA